MKEFMILAFPNGDHLASLSVDEKKQHLDKVMAYLENLRKKGKLISAQPLAGNGKVVSGQNGLVTDGPYIETKESVAGYFHIIADSLEEATQIAFENPLFDLKSGGKLEVRPIVTPDLTN